MFFVNIHYGSLVPIIAPSKKLNLFSLLWKVKDDHQDRNELQFCAGEWVRKKYVIMCSSLRVVTRLNSYIPGMVTESYCLPILRNACVSLLRRSLQPAMTSKKSLS